MATSGKVAIVTGAAQGIGKAITLRLAKDGFNVVISDLEGQNAGMDEVARTAGEVNPNRKFICVPCDVTSEEQVQKLVDETVNQFGRLNCMVANAGILILDTFSDIKVEDFRKLMDVNAIGLLLCYRVAAAAMVKCGTAKGGRLIGACSVAGKRGIPLHGAYCATKHAVKALTQTAAIEYGPTGITVNAYAPGLIETSMLDVISKAGSESTGESPDKFMEKMAKANIMQRMGKPVEIADLVGFIASDESAYITGQCISINGGNWFD